MKRSSSALVFTKKKRNVTPWHTFQKRFWDTEGVFLCDNFTFVSMSCSMVIKRDFYLA